MRRKTSSNHSIGNEFPSQRQLTLNYSKLIRKIWNKHNRLSKKQQAKAIQLLPGITSDLMESIMKSTGPKGQNFSSLFEKGQPLNWFEGQEMNVFLERAKLNDTLTVKGFKYKFSL